jgi:hypothetical protein
MVLATSLKGARLFIALGIAQLIIFCINSNQGVHALKPTVGTKNIVRKMPKISKNEYTPLRAYEAGSRSEAPLAASGDSSRRSSLPPWLPSFATAALGGLLFGR